MVWVRVGLEEKTSSSYDLKTSGLRLGSGMFVLAEDMADVGLKGARLGIVWAVDTHQDCPDRLVWGQINVQGNL